MKKQAQQGSSYLITIAVLAVVLAISAGALFCILFQSREKARKYDDYLQLGQKYLSEMKYEDAILVFQDAVRLDPKRAEVYVELVSFYTEQGMYEEAEQVLSYAEAHVAKKVQSEITSARERLEKEKKEETKRTASPKAHQEETSSPEADDSFSPTPESLPVPTKGSRPTATPVPQVTQESKEPTGESDTETWTITKSNTGIFDEYRTITYKKEWKKGSTHTVITKWDPGDSAEYPLMLVEHQIDFEKHTISIVMDAFEGNSGYTEIVIDLGKRSYQLEGFEEP